MLSVSDVSKRFGDLLVLDRVSFSVNPGDRIGVVGPNGTGKTTLLAILAGALAADEGAVSFAPGTRTGYLRQGALELERQPLAALLDGPLDGLLNAQAELETATTALASAGDGDALDAALARLDTASARFEDRGGYASVDRLGALLGGIGLDDVALDTQLDTLSGGQKTRAGLAALLASEADLLLLDEPTNHLDADALDWLGGFLRGYRGAVVVVSHDRAFLDDTVETIFAIDDRTRRLAVTPGNYSDFLAAQVAAAEAQEDAYQRQQREVARIERDIRDLNSHAIGVELSTIHFAPRKRAKKVARTAKVRERKLEKRLAGEDAIERPERRWGLALDFGERHESGRDVAVAEQVSVAFDGTTVLRELDLHVRFGERVALTGPNGGGKSTLIRLLAGTMTPDSGHVRLGAGVVPGVYAQEQETVALERTVLDQARAVAGRSESDTRTFLHQFLFQGDAVHRRAGDLSYGERARLALSLLVLRGANFLLLDEPLNHLDLPSREAFEEALTGFGGTLLIVLHDRYAIARVATRVLELRDGRLTER